MVIPTTGIVFLFGVLVYFYLSWKFRKVYKKENNNTAKWFSYAFLLQGIYYLLQGVLALFLVDNPQIWRIVDPIRISITVISYLIIGYAIFKTAYPRFTPYFIFFIFTSGMLSVVLFIIYPPSYFYINGSMSWSWQVGLITKTINMISVFAVLLTFIFFFFREAKRTEDKSVKIRSLGLGLFFFLWIVSGMTDTVLCTVFNLNPVYSDLNYLITFLILAITLVKTWIAPSQKWVKKD